MNRIEFMTELAALLQDVPEEERRDAMQFYNDYFDDAGVDKEGEVLSELESPAKVAEKIKADLLGQQGGGEFTENGYQERSVNLAKKVPAAREGQAAGQDPGNKGYSYREDESSAGYAYEGSAQGNTAYSYDKNPEEKKPWSSNVLKILLIIGIVLVGGPIVIPCAIAIIAVAVSCVVGLLCFFFAIVIGFAAIAIIGVVLVCAGLIALIPEIAVGLALIGTGLILGVIGTVGTLAGVKLCIVMIPGIIRGIVWLCRKPFQRKAVA